MKQIKDYLKKPLVVFGDFNEILSEGEKEGGRNKRDNQMQTFRDAINRCGPKDLGLANELFTWEKEDIRQRLDRFLADATGAVNFQTLRSCLMPDTTRPCWHYCLKQRSKGGCLSLTDHSRWNLCVSLKRATNT